MVLAAWDAPWDEEPPGIECPIPVDPPEEAGSGAANLSAGALQPARAGDVDRSANTASARRRPDGPGASAFRGRLGSSRTGCHAGASMWAVCVHD